MIAIFTKPNTGEVALSGVVLILPFELCGSQKAPNKTAPTNVNTANTTSMSSFTVRSTEGAPSLLTWLEV
jgi:hypothetical protein